MCMADLDDTSKMTYCQPGSFSLSSIITHQHLVLVECIAARGHREGWLWLFVVLQLYYLYLFCLSLALVSLAARSDLRLL